MADSGMILTRMNVRRAVQEVKNTDRLGYWLGVPYTRRQEIQRQFSSVPQQVKAYIDYFMDHDPLASWRSVIGALDAIGEKEAADNIRHLAEFITDPTLNYNNLHRLTASVKKWLDLGDYDSGLGVPLAVLHEIDINTAHQTEEKKKEALLLYFLHNVPMASWQRVAGALHWIEEEKTAVRAFTIFTPAEPSLTPENLSTVLAIMDDDLWEEFGICVNIPDSEQVRIRSQCSSEREMKQACILYLISRHPCLSWILIAHALYQMVRWDNGDSSHRALDRLQQLFPTGRYRFKQIYEHEMKRGHIELDIDKGLLFGLAGTGKTSALDVLLKRYRRKLRCSTSLMRRPITVVFMSVDDTMDWKEWAAEKMKEIIAEIIRSRDPKQQAVAQSDASPASPDQQPSPTTASQSPQPTPEKTSSSTSAAGKTTPSSEKKPTDRGQPEAGGDLASLLQSTEVDEGFVSLINSAPPSTEPILRVKQVLILDSGGQLALLEMMPVFLNGASKFTYVFKAHESLDKRAMIQYFKDGKLVWEYEAPQTNEAYMKQCIRTMRSLNAKNPDIPPAKMLFLATHRDMVPAGKLPGVLESLHKRLKKILLPQFKEQLIYCNEKEEDFIFTMNAAMPDDEDRKCGQAIRECLSKSEGREPVKVPLRWHSLYHRLLEVMNGLGKKVLPREQCRQVAESMQIDDESCEEALNFFNGLNMLFYFPAILPDLVFIDPQMLLDKLSEVVDECNCMRQGEKQEPMVGEKLKFRNYGQVTEKFLGTFETHYEPPLFTPKELITLLKGLLVLAYMSEDTYFMPCLLRVVTSEVVEKCRVSGEKALAIHFPDSGPLMGVYCSTVAYLLSPNNTYPSTWKVVENKAGNPVCLHRNVIKFSIPKMAGSISLIDHFTHFEVHVHTHPKKAAELWKLAHDGVFAGMKKAGKTIGYTDNTPVSAMVCPTHSATPHPATVDSSKCVWTCSETTKVFGDVPPEDTIPWLPVCDTHIGGKKSDKPPTPSMTSTTPAVLDDHVCFLGEPHEVAVQSEPVTISPPGLGVTLKIPPNAVQSSDEPVNVSLRACLPNTVFQYPEGCTPLSAVYHISSNSAFDENIELSIEHFADLETDRQANEMTFFRAESEEKGKYSFTPMEGGVFKVGGHRCTISTRLVPSFVSAGSIPSSQIRKRYSVLCSYSNNTESVRHVAVAISLDDAVFITNFRKILEKQWKLPLSHRFQTNVFFKESSAKVNYRQSHLKGWKVVNKLLSTLSRKDVDNCNHSTLTQYHYPPHIILDVIALENAKPSTLQLSLIGLTDQCEFHVSLTKMTKTLNRTVNMPTLRNLSTTSEGDINIIHTSAIFNHYVGTLLLNDRYGDRFDYETREKAKDIMEEVYEAWLTEDTNCSWVTLTDCFRQCGLHSLAYSIEQHFGLPSPLLVTKVDRKSYEEAMNSGFIKAALASLIFVGVTGSGKSLFQKLVLGLPVPESSPSTPLAVRNMSICQVAVDGQVKWNVVAPEKMIEIVAKEAQEQGRGISFKQEEKTRLEAKTPEKMDSIANESKTKHKLIDSTAQIEKSEKIDDKEKSDDEVIDKPRQMHAVVNQKVADKSKTHAPSEKVIEKADRNEQRPIFRKCLDQIVLDQYLMQRIKTPTGKKELMEINFINMLDSGGQLPFRELLPHIVQQSSGIVLMQKLNERLDFRPTITYREEGVEDKGYPSPLTNEQILYQYFQAVQSHNSTVFVVGTHRDREHECEEKKDTKNENLLKGFRQVMHKVCIALYKTGKPEQLIFPVDSIRRKEEDLATAEEFRKAVVSNCIDEVEKKPIPLPWFLLEQLLQQLAQKMEVTVLSMSECHNAAKEKLGISNKMCKEAIKYLGELNVLFYRPKILEEVVFCNAQVILDMISKFVLCSHRMQTNSDSESTPQCMKVLEWSKFCDSGQIDPKLLTKAFSQYYRDNVFTASNFLKLLEGLLIAAKLQNGKFFIPSVLPYLQDVPQHRVTFTDHPPPRTVYYPDTWLPVGVMPALLVSLINNCEWKILSEDGKPVCMYHNCMEFQLPRASVTLIDSIKFLEIHVKPVWHDSEVCRHSEVCSRIMEDIMSSLEEAHKSLHYDPPTAKEGTLCPGTCGTKEIHFAKLDEKKNIWTCSNKPSKVGLLDCYWSENEDQKTDSPDISVDLKTYRGIAILVTCDYESTSQPLPGTRVDAEEMEKTFNELNYNIHKLMNVSKCEIQSRLTDISKYLEKYQGSMKDKVIVFAFSGHGCNKDGSDQLLANDMETLNFEDEILLPLARHKKVANIPKLFFIDACRGDSKLIAKGDAEENVKGFSAKGVKHVEAKYRIDYATIPYHKAYSSKTGSVWMPKVARALREKDDSLQNIMAGVNDMVNEKCEEQVSESVEHAIGILYLQRRVNFTWLLPYVLCSVIVLVGVIVYMQPWGRT